jgi:hypothetical protein
MAATLPETSSRPILDRVVAVHLTYSILLVFATTFIHACFTAAMVGWLRGEKMRSPARRYNVVTTTLVLSTLVLAMGLAAYVESALWAAFYVWVGALPVFDDALYFSLVTYTTLGYGDVTLNEEWRILGAFQSANGIIMFGWTTAVIAAVAHRLFFQPAADSLEC